MSDHHDTLTLPVALTFTGNVDVPAAVLARIVLKVLRRRYGVNVVWLASDHDNHRRAPRGNVRAATGTVGEGRQRFFRGTRHPDAGQVGLVPSRSAGQMSTCSPLPAEAK